MRVLSNGGDTAGGFINGKGYGDGREPFSGEDNGVGADYCWGTGDGSGAGLFYIHKGCGKGSGSGDYHGHSEDN